MKTPFSQRNFALLVLFGLLLVIAVSGGRRSEDGRETSGGKHAVNFEYQTRSAKDTVPSESGPRLKIEFNVAEQRELQLLPGVGPKLAEELIRYRDANYPVVELGVLLEVPGIGPSKLGEMEPYLDFGPQQLTSPQVLANDSRASGTAATQPLDNALP